ncbi:MAG: TIGR03936 family radical SAM-associated protein [Anaerolineales bacterium]
MRARITFSKQGALRYIGHLDLHQLWERAMRRAALPLSYSQGFHPQPKINLACALPLGFSSRAEMLDARFNEDLPLTEIQTRLQENLPADICITRIEQIDERAPALQTQVLSAAYDVRFSEPIDADALMQNASAMMMAETLPRERRGKPYDLRPLIEMLNVIKQPDGEVWLRMTLAAREGATGRPEEVLSQLGIEPDTARVERTRLIFQDSSPT